MTIRDESPTDCEAIREVIRGAFRRDIEAQLVDRLRSERLIIRSRVAVENERVVGQILFSRVWIETDDETVTVASLAPMAVDPDYQQRRIGSALVQDGIDMCRQEGWRAIIVVGHPHYYPRFGFSPDLVVHLKSPYAGEAFMGLELIPGALTRVQGVVRYPKAFELFS